MQLHSEIWLIDAISFVYFKWDSLHKINAKIKSITMWYFGPACTDGLCMFVMVVSVFIIIQLFFNQAQAFPFGAAVG